MLRVLAILVAAVSLLVSLAAPILYFQGQIGMARYKEWLLYAAFGWFLCAAFLASPKKRSERRAGEM